MSQQQNVLWTVYRVELGGQVFVYYQPKTNFFQQKLKPVRYRKCKSVKNICFKSFIKKQKLYQNSVALKKSVKIYDYYYAKKSF